MREIKFRGRDTDRNWHYGDLLRYVRDSYDMIIPAGHANSDNLYDDVVCVDYDTIGQYTGLKDCEGREIFEGDILRYLPPWRWVDTKRIGVVVFEDYSFYVKNEYTTDLLFNIAVNSDGAPFEVIGSIYDNPELLEATK